MLRTVIADSVDEKVWSHQLRHSVFCVEKAYWPVRDDGLEVDEYDSYSAIVLILDDEVPIGTSRMVLRSPLPLEVAFPLSFSSAGEISRTVLIPDRRNDAEVFKIIIRSMVEIAVSERLEYIVGLLERSLAKYIRRFGVPIEAISGDINHYGLRKVYMVRTEMAVLACNALGNLTRCG